MPSLTSSADPSLVNLLHIWLLPEQNHCVWRVRAKMLVSQKRDTVPRDDDWRDIQVNEGKQVNPKRGFVLLCLHTAVQVATGETYPRVRSSLIEKSFREIVRKSDDAPDWVTSIFGGQFSRFAVRKNRQPVRLQNLVVVVWRGGSVVTEHAELETLYEQVEQTWLVGADLIDRITPADRIVAQIGRRLNELTAGRDPAGHSLRATVASALELFQPLLMQYRAIHSSPKNTIYPPVDVVGEPSCANAYIGGLDSVRERYWTTTYPSSGFWAEPSELSSGHSTATHKRILSANRKMMDRLNDTKNVRRIVLLPTADLELAAEHRRCELRMYRQHNRKDELSKMVDRLHAFN